MNHRALILVPLVGCHAGYLSATHPTVDSDQPPTVDPDLVSTWVGACDITEVSRPASPDAKDGIEISVAFEVTGQQLVCSGDLGTATACYSVIAPAVNADWRGGGTGELNPQGSGPSDILIQVQAEGYCDPGVQGCDPSWDLYLWGAAHDGVFEGDCQSISTGIDDNYPVTWGSGAFVLEAR